MQVLSLNESTYCIVNLHNTNDERITSSKKRDNASFLMNIWLVSRVLNNCCLFICFLFFVHFPLFDKIEEEGDKAFNKIKKNIYPPQLNPIKPIRTFF